MQRLTLLFHNITFVCKILIHIIFGKLLCEMFSYCIILYTCMYEFAFYWSISEQFFGLIQYQKFKRTLHFMIISDIVTRIDQVFYLKKKNNYSFLLLLSLQKYPGNFFTPLNIAILVK